MDDKHFSMIRATLREQQLIDKRLLDIAEQEGIAAADLESLRRSIHQNQGIRLLNNLFIDDFAEVLSARTKLYAQMMSAARHELIKVGFTSSDALVLLKNTQLIDLSDVLVDAAAFSLAPEDDEG